jgi:serine/threonine-protein kinase HipA
MQTLCGAAHYDFHIHRAYSYEQAFGVMRRLHLPYSQAQEMFRRMVFNVVIRNQDDHTKNISFLMGEDGTWNLSPAYDMGYAFNPSGEWTSTHQMSVNGKFDGITRKDLIECASLNSIKEADTIIDSIVDCVADWPIIARECEVPDGMIKAISPNFVTL